MFTHRTILSLQADLPGGSAPVSVSGYFREDHVVRNVMEVKHYLLRCLRNINPILFPTPDFILIDAGRSNRDIKSELERWMEAHPRLQRVKIVFPRKWSWMKRWWKQLGSPGNCTNAENES
jgi:hypothetical protein